MRPPVVVVVALTGLIAVAGSAMSLWLTSPPQDWLALVILCTLGLMSQGLRESDVGQRVTLSFLSIIQLASIPLLGPFGAALVGGLAHGFDPNRVPLIQRVFNGGMTASLGWVGGTAYLLVGGTSTFESMGAGPLLLHVAAPLMFADVIQMLVNASFIASILWAERRVPARVTLVGMVSTSGLSYLGYGAIGFLLVVLWIPAGVGPFSAVLILAPLFVARWAIVQYGDEVRAHESALSALVTAVETKDPHSAGHSDRLGLIVEWFVEPLGLSVPEVSSLRLVAMLHDVGRVSLPAHVVRLRQDVGREDLRSLATHPALGVDLLRTMTFIEPALEGIRHHHERWDGRGYPDGLQGHEIPLVSRVVAVATAFDSLTAARPGRPALSSHDALVELEARAGVQFDPAVVAALGKALERNAWDPVAVPPEELAVMRALSYLDHDDPAVSDIYAELVADTEQRSKARR